VIVNLSASSSNKLEIIVDSIVFYKHTFKHCFVNILQGDKSPNSDKTLGGYIKRIRLSLGLNQRELAAMATIHLQSLGKIERGLTAKLSSHSKTGLTSALQVPVEYLEAVSRGTSIESVSMIKFCPSCWTPGNPADQMWMDVRANFCFISGGKLCDHCTHCQQTISSLKHRFCPFCGSPYKSKLWIALLSLSCRFLHVSCSYPSSRNVVNGYF
jgi:DNA-binding XRE family transcriptional regulator